MKRLLALFFLLVSCMPSLAAEPRPFARGSWSQIEAAHRGQRLVVHLWGITCPPCLAELPNWARLAKERPDLKLVLIAADPVPQADPQIAATLEHAGLGGVESWSFADRFVERLRYEIDRGWAGELPRTLLIAPDGTRTAITGLADLEKVRAWLGASATPRVQK
jgi:thiol-disulfide isomerase/thioredoxin